MLNAPVLDRATIATLRAMDVLTHEDELLLELVDDFLLYSAELVTAMQLSSQLQVDHELATQSHSLKGASLNIGALALFEVCDTIELMARAQRLSTREHWQTTLNRAYEATTAVLIELRSRTSRGESIDDLLG